MRWFHLLFLGMFRWVDSPPSLLGTLFGLALIATYINMFVSVFKEPEYKKRERERKERIQHEEEIRKSAEAEYQSYLDSIPYDRKYEIVSYYCDGLMDGMTPDYVERYFDAISRGKEETLPRYNKERHIQKYGVYAKRYLYEPPKREEKQEFGDVFEHMFWW